VWGIAFFGTILKLFFTGKFEAFSLVLYAIMGWLVVIDLPYIIAQTTSNQLFFLGLGGAFYTVGILFYAIKRIPFNHFIWHLFVLAGAISHWFMIYRLR
jgi:hemolysin III